MVPPAPILQRSATVQWKASIIHRPMGTMIKIVNPNATMAACQREDRSILHMAGSFRIVSATYISPFVLVKDNATIYA